MPTNKTRVNISLSKGLENLLTRLAKRDGVPQATKARELIVRAIEIEEDDAGDRIASDRDTPSSQLVSHKQAWQ